MRALLYTLLARLRDFVRPAAGEADFDQELEMHLAMAEDDKVRSGMSREEARRQARLELGGVAQLREAARGARGLPWLDTFWLDAKLGVRMLRKSWGLTLVGGLAMALTIGLGASIFNIWDTFAGTRLPLDEGDRVVAIQPFDRASQRVSTSTSFADFRRWREALKSIEYVSAMRSIDRTVLTRDGAIGPVRGAEMSASAFQLARVRPLLGRTLIDEDERVGAEPVAVIGYQLWQSAFSSDSALLGQRIQIADTPHTIVGVMPESFRFPMNQRLWIPLHIERIGETDPKSDVFVFGRLAPGASREGAQTEVATIGVLPRTGASQTTASLDARVVPYAAGFFPEVHASSWAGRLIFLLGALFLIPPCANIAILVYARTVTRREEFAARTALGASRARVVMQLFVELLVLAAGAGIVGFLLARQFSGRLSRIVMPTMRPENLPFWMDFTPSLFTVLCVAGLSVLAAAIAGGVPAFHATGRWRRSGFATIGSRGSATRLGKTWIALLATQVALTLAILPSAAEMLWGIFRPTIIGPGLAVQEFLTASLVMEGDTSRFDILKDEAVRQLRSETGIAGVTVSATKLLEEPAARIEVEGRAASDDDARFNVVDDRFFAVFGARFLAGRNFDTRDFGPGSTALIVNRSFVAEILGDGNGLGRRVRYRRIEDSAQVQPPPGSHDIIGVVEDFPGSNDGPMMFHPMTMPLRSVSLTIRTASGLASAADRLRAVAARLDPQLRVGRLRSLEDMYWQRRALDHTFGVVLGSVVVLVVLFSMAGMYTLMAFIVAQRWREIGVRSALGAQPRRLLGGIFGRALVPLMIGASVGCALAVGLHSWLPITEAGGRSIPGIVLVSAVLMIVVGLLAVSGPARRAIRIDPTEALRVLCILFAVAVPASAQQAEWKDPSPHTAKMVTVDDNVQLEVLDWGGSGPALVLLAGLGDTAHVFDDFAQMLTAKYRVVGMTRRGHGRSSAPSVGYGAARLGEDIVRVIDTMGVNRPVVVGHSFAGEEMHVLGARDSAKIAGLVYLDAAFNRADGSDDYDAVARTLPRPPNPGPADLASFATLRAFLVGIQGGAGPEAHLRAKYVANADGTIARPWAPDLPVRQALTAEMQAWSKAYNPDRVRVPAVAIYDVPKSAADLMRPWYAADDPSIRERVDKLYRLARERFDRHATWFKAFADGGRVSELAGGHYVFIIHPSEVLQEIDAFVASLSKPTPK